MERGLASLDLRFLVKELGEFLAGGMIRKIYQYDPGSIQFLFDVFVSGKGSFLLYVDKNKIFLTGYKRPAPEKPPNFCLLLRKHLESSKIKNVKQHGFDRIIEIETDNNVLIIELFSDGNIILCDKEGNIIMPFSSQEWKDRNVKPKIKYEYPPSAKNPFELDFDQFSEMVKQSEKKIIVFLAATLGFGSAYAKEICFRAGVDENMPSDQIEDLKVLYEALKSLGDENLNPCIYDDLTTPFPFKSKGEPKKQTGKFSEALDEFFSEARIQKECLDQGEAGEQKERIKRIIEQQKEAVKKWEKIKADSRSIADSIYNFYDVVQNVLFGLKKARDMGLSWQEIKERIAEESSAEAGVVKEIREGDRVVVLSLAGKEIELDFTKSVEKNAEKYYEEAKWANEKLGKALEAMKHQEKQLNIAESKPVEKKSVLKKVKGVKKWYEKFRWFFSSDGFLIIAGKDATTNEILIKKHTEPYDLVFHADVTGAPFVVIKTEGKNASQETKKEAAEFAAAYSKAWSAGLGAADVYCIKPDQVSKKPPAGEYLAKGAFMIYGSKEWFRNVELRLAIGVKISGKSAEVLVGPYNSVKKQTDYFVTIRPGDKKSSELAKIIKMKILKKAKPEEKSVVENILLDEFQRIIPSGKGEVDDGNY